MLRYRHKTKKIEKSCGLFVNHPHSIKLFNVDFLHRCITVDFFAMPCKNLVPEAVSIDEINFVLVPVTEKKTTKFPSNKSNFDALILKQT